MRPGPAVHIARRWLRWRPFVRIHQLQGHAGADSDYSALHRTRSLACLARRVDWRMIERYDLDSPIASEIKFQTMLEWAVGLKRPRKVRKVS